MELTNEEIMRDVERAFKAGFEMASVGSRDPGRPGDDERAFAKYRSEHACCGLLLTEEGRCRVAGARIRGTVTCTGFVPAWTTPTHSTDLCRCGKRWSDHTLEERNVKMDAVKMDAPKDERVALQDRIAELERAVLTGVADRLRQANVMREVLAQIERAPLHDRNLLHELEHALLVGQTELVRALQVQLEAARRRIADLEATIRKQETRNGDR